MFTHRSRAGIGPRGRWLLATVVAAVLALSPRATFAQSITGLNANPATMGSYLTIYGSDFGEVQGRGYVLLADRPLPVLAWSTVAISVYVMPPNTNTFPFDAPQKLVVVRSDGKRSNEFDFTISAPPGFTPPATTTPGTTTPGTTTPGTTTPGTTTPGTTTPGTTTPGTTTPGTTQPTEANRQVLNDSLLMERLAAQFFNQNANKAYLSSAVTTPPTTTPGTTTPGTDSGTTPGTGAGTGTGTGGGGGTAGPGIAQDTTPGTTPGTTGGNQFTAALSGSEEVPPVTTSASGTATFALSDNNQLAYDVQVTGLSGPANAMHLHRGARGVAGDVIYPLTTPDANGRASGTVTINEADIQPLREGTIYINVHTAANPAGEVRGQVVLAAQSPGTSDSNLAALRGMVEEIRAHHTEHVATLEQALGTDAQAAPSFRNAALDAPTLQQFLEMAQAIEDFTVGVHQNTIISIAPAQPSTTPGTTTPGTTAGQSPWATVVAIALDDARHAGAIRAYRKMVPTAEGGDPNIPLTEEGALNQPRTREQLTQFVQQYIESGTTTPGTTTPGATTPGTTTPGTTTPGTTTPGTTTPGTTTPGTTTPGTTPSTTPGSTPAGGAGPY